MNLSRELETPRLRLRPFALRDAEPMYALLRDPVVNTFLPWFPAQTLAEAEEMLRSRYIGGPGVHYAVCLRGEDAYSVCPYAYLVYRGGAECIRCGKNNFLSALFHDVCYLCNRRGLSYSVYADDEYDRHFSVIFRDTFSVADHILQHIEEYLLRFFGVCYMIVLYFFAEIVYYLLCDLNADVGAYQNLFELFKEFFVHLCKCAEKIIYLSDKSVLCLCKTGFEFFKKAHFIYPFS